MGVVLESSQGERRPSRESSVISLEKVVLTYNKNLTALNDVTLAVKKREHIALYGPSGSGKTTLLRCISQSLIPTHGRVSVVGQIASIYQDLRLVSQKSALTNVLHGSMGRYSFFRTLFGFPQDEKLAALRLLERVGLGDRAHCPIYTLSGGEKQRVAIARALMQNPEIILADEPVSALDEISAHGVLRLMNEISTERGITLVMVLHDADLAERYANRLVYLENGQIKEDYLLREKTTILRPAKIDEGKKFLHLFAEKTLPISTPSKKYLLGIVAMLLLFSWALSSIRVRDYQFRDTFSGLLGFLGQLLPSSWEAVTDIPWSTLAHSLLETLHMAFLGTTLGLVLSWPLAALAAKNIGPSAIRRLVRLLLNMIRTVPSILWALLFVAAVGLGPLAGVLALTCYSVGYLAKFFYETFESIEQGPQQALREIGASGLQRFLHAVWPASRAAALSSCFFMFEYNVRAASVLGIVDAGGIGFYIKEYIDFRSFPAVTASLLMILLVVLALDIISNKVRERLVKCN